MTRDTNILTDEQREAVDNLTDVLDEYRPRAIRAEQALRKIAGMMDEEALDAYLTRDEAMFPSDYWDGLGNPDEAFFEGRSVGQSEAAAVARDALSDLGAIPAPEGGE